MSKRKRKASEIKLESLRVAVDNELINQIAPSGGATPHISYIQKSDGFECSLYVLDFPYENVALWGEYFKFENCVTFIQIDPIETDQLKQSLNTTLEEYKDRVASPTTKRVDKDFALREYQRLSPIVELLNNDESFFNMSMRINVAERELGDLEERVKKIQSELKKHGYKAIVLNNEQSNESRVPFRTLKKDTIYKRDGKIVPTGAFGGAFPFTYTSLNDTRGVHLGYTNEGGQVIFDMFHKTSKRLSYNGAVFGTMGSGKSTFLLKLAKHMMIVGNKLRFIDPVGQSAQMISWLGGEVISLDGSKDSKVLNPLARSQKLEDDSSEIETTLSKAETFMRIIAPDLNGNELALFGVELKPLYEEKEQPIFEDVLKRVVEKLEDSSLSDNMRTHYENLHIQLSRIVLNYGNMFNAATTLETTSARGVCYAMRDLVQKDETIYQAQLFNVLTHLWNELYRVGKPQLDKFTSGELAIEDVEFYCVMMDEAHHILNSTNPHGVKYCSIFMREARKYFGGMLYATQGIKDIVRGEMSSDLESLFERTQYKYIFKEDQNALGVYEKVFENQLTNEELKDIPNLNQGEFLLCSRGEPTLKTITKDVVSQEELEWFGGGR